MVLHRAVTAGVKAVVFSFDEVHNMYKVRRPRLVQHVDELCDMVAKAFPSLHLFVLGFTATPLFDMKDADRLIERNAVTLFGEDLHQVRATTEQELAIKAEINPNPPPIDIVELMSS